MFTQFGPINQREREIAESWAEQSERSLQAMSREREQIMETLCIEVCDEDEELSYILPAEPQPVVRDTLAYAVKAYYQLAEAELEASRQRVERLERVGKRLLATYLGIHGHDSFYAEAEATLTDKAGGEMSTEICPNCGLNPKRSTTDQQPEVCEACGETLCDSICLDQHEAKCTGG